MEKITLNFNDKVIILSFKEFDTDINVDELTKIQYDNLYGEIITSSTLLNQVGLLRAEFESITKSEKVDLEIYEAQLRKMFRSQMTTEGKKLTQQELEDKVLLDEGWQNRKKKLIKVERDFEYIQSIYWAIQSKDKKLSILSKAVTPEEFQDGIIEGAVNGIMIKKVTKKF